MDAGLQSIPGGGANLDDEVRAKIARLKCTRTTGKNAPRGPFAGLRTTATMMFGCGKSCAIASTISKRLRRIQEDTGGFTAFHSVDVCHGKYGAWEKSPEATAVDYLKTLASAACISTTSTTSSQAGSPPESKSARSGLQFGADDVGSILIEENVVFAPE